MFVVVLTPWTKLAKMGHFFSLLSWLQPHHLCCNTPNWRRWLLHLWTCLPMWQEHWMVSRTVGSEFHIKYVKQRPNIHLFQTLWDAFICTSSLRNPIKLIHADTLSLFHVNTNRGLILQKQTHPPVHSTLFCACLSSPHPGLVPTTQPSKFLPTNELLTNGSSSAATQGSVVKDEVKISLTEAEVVPSCGGLKWIKQIRKRLLSGIWLMFSMRRGGLEDSSLTLHVTL